ncbi:MAG: hypothetical protein ACI8RZ_001789 [Myxococcota bacterium]|jgi:hypothetical protein
MSQVVRLGLLALGLIGAVMIWQWWGHPSQKTAIFTSMVGGVLIVLAGWGLALPRFD